MVGVPFGTLVGLLVGTKVCSLLVGEVVGIPVGPFSAIGEIVGSGEGASATGPTFIVVGNMCCFVGADGHGVRCRVVGTRVG